MTDSPSAAGELRVSIGSSLGLGFYLIGVGTLLRPVIDLCLSRRTLLFLANKPAEVASAPLFPCHRRACASSFECPPSPRLILFMSSSYCFLAVASVAFVFGSRATNAHCADR